MFGVGLNKTNAISSIWTKARAASTRLGVSWEFSDDGSFALAKGEEVISCRTKVFKSLREVFRKERSNTLRRKKQKGKTLPCFSKHNVSAHYNRTGDFIRFADWNFVHKARLGLVRFNAYSQQSEVQDTRCKRCGNYAETLPHVICHCLPHMAKITRRHDAIVERVKKNAVGRWSIYSENRAG